MRRWFLLLCLVSPVASIGEGLDVDAMLKAFVSMGSLFSGNVKTVGVETDLLMGKWHQMFKAAMNFDVFRSSMYCEVAYFRSNSVMRRRGGFEMLEAYRVTDKAGNVEVYKRDIARSEPPVPGKYWMHTKEYFYPREFNIVKVGAVYENRTESDNGTLVGYDYMVVTDSRRTSLMVFARDPAEFRARYQDEVQEYFKEQCFGNGCFWNTAERIYQEPDCIYPTEKEIRVRRALKNHLSQRGQATPSQSFLQTLAGQVAAAPSNDRRPQVQLSPQSGGVFGGIDPMQALQGFLSNLPALSTSLGKKK